MFVEVIERPRANGGALSNASNDPGNCEMRMAV